MRKHESNLVMSDSKFPFSFPVEAERVASTQGAVTVEPADEDRQRIAQAYELEAMPALKADLNLSPWRKAGIRVHGTVKAILRQRCGVTLEIFDQELTDEIDRTFEPLPKSPRTARDLNDEGEIEIQMESIDPPDVIENGKIDLGAVICEQLALNIDPFPRKPGVAFEAALTGETDEGEDDGKEPSPFAVLAKLKDGSTH